MNKTFSIILLSVLLVACGHKTTYDPFSISPANSNDSNSSSAFEIEFKTTASNVKTIHVKFNDAVGKDAIFDTGCSGLLISHLEYLDLQKEGKIGESDFLDYGSSSIADGSIITNRIYNIREVSVVDKTGQVHTLNNIQATVIENLEADILIGSSVIDGFAKHSYTVDLDNNVIRFQ